MKSLHWLRLIAILLSGQVRADDAHFEFGKDVDSVAKTITTFTADLKELDKVFKWSPGDRDFLSLEKLVKLATERAKPPQDGHKYEEGGSLGGVEWRQVSQDTQIWMVTAPFVFLPVEDKRVERLGFAKVYLLSNGAPVVATTRQMSDEEQASWGIKEMTEKEKEEMRKKMPPDPFAPKSPK